MSDLDAIEKTENQGCIRGLVMIDWAIPVATQWMQVIASSRTIASWPILIRPALLLVGLAVELLGIWGN